jgi:hypothetical protein
VSVPVPVLGVGVGAAAVGALGFLGGMVVLVVGLGRVWGFAWNLWCRSGGWWVVGVVDG